MDEKPSSSRRDFLSGKALRASVERAGDKLADAITDGDAIPEAGVTVQLGKRAMACDFDVILNPGNAAHLQPASAALETVDALEEQMSVYRETSEMSRINRDAAAGAVVVEEELFALLRRAEQLCHETDGGFDPTAGPIVALWRECKSSGRIPTDGEVTDAMQRVGLDHVSFDTAQRTVKFDRPGIELNLNSIGKGYALDRAGDVLNEAGVEDWMLHGGHSSLLARGKHGDLKGWPVGIRHPLFPERRLATILLRDCGMSTSGTGVQYFRHRGNRYGHILDPRTGWPVEGMLSVTVLAETAAEADALSTAFFVIGVEKAQEYCHNHKGVCALLIPPPTQHKRLEPVICGIPDDMLFFTPED